MPARKIGGQIGLVAIIGWAVIEYFGFTLKHSMLVISIVCLICLVLVWRYREDGR